MMFRCRPIVTTNETAASTAAATGVIIVIIAAWWCFSESESRAVEIIWRTSVHDVGLMGWRVIE